MILLLLFAVLAAAITIWFLARPLRVVTTTLPAEERDALVQLRDRLVGQLREIDVEAADSNIDPTTAADERQRLEAELAQVLRQLDTAAESVQASIAGDARRTWLIAVLALAAIVPILSAVLYFGQNITVLANLSEAARPEVAANGQGVPPMVLQMVARLEERLQQQPNDPKGWAQLGRSYVVLGRPEEAASAYQRAYQQAPEDPDIMSAYGGFLLARHPQKPPAEAVAIFQKLLAQNPKNPNALWSLGLISFYQEKFPDAVKYWERLAKVLPPDNDSLPHLQRAIETAKARAGGQKK